MMIKIEPNPNGSHANQTITPRVIPEGWIEVPLHLEADLIASSFFCDLIFEGGALTGVTPTERPPEPEPIHTPDPITETQLAVAELAQVMEENNTANQLAIAELAEAILGG